MKNLVTTKTYKYYLLVIVMLALLLRFVGLGANPVSLTWDEAAWGYNAYTLGVDGRDEFGVFLPFQYLESFGDFKPPLYAYVSILPVKLFGLNEFSTRFASAFFGTLTVLLSYFLVKKLFESSSRKEIYALMTAFLLAISPWHIMLSRAAFEANLVTFFLCLGVYLFLKGIKDNGIYLILSALPFALSFYTFNTARIVTPILVLMLCLSAYKQLWSNRRKEILVTGILGIALLMPTLPFLFSPQAALRFKEVNIFSDIRVIERVNTEVANDHNALWSKAIHHRYLAYGVEFLKHYFDHFNPDFLFISGDQNPKFSTQDVGQLYLFELPFLIIGFFVLFKKREGFWWIIPLWLLIGILPAATARETPHALRIEATLPTFQIVTAIGITWLFWYIREHLRRLFFPAVMVGSLLVLLNVAYFLHGYIVHYPREYSGEWQYGYKDSINFVKQVESKYDEIHVTEDLGRPYIYYLFYTKPNPAFFRSNAVVNRDVFGFVDVASYGKYHFMKGIDAADKQNVGRNILYLSFPGHVPEGAHVIKRFPMLNGIDQFVAYTM